MSTEIRGPGPEEAGSDIPDHEPAMLDHMIAHLRDRDNDRKTTRVGSAPTADTQEDKSVDRLFAAITEAAKAQQQLQELGELVKEDPSLRTYILHRLEDLKLLASQDSTDEVVQERVGLWFVNHTAEHYRNGNYSVKNQLERQTPIDRERIEYLRTAIEQNITEAYQQLQTLETTNTRTPKERADIRRGLEILDTSWRFEATNHLFLEKVLQDLKIFRKEHNF